MSNLLEMLVAKSRWKCNGDWRGPSCRWLFMGTHLSPVVCVQLLRLHGHARLGSFALFHRCNCILQGTRGDIVSNMAKRRVTSECTAQANDSSRRQEIKTDNSMNSMNNRCPSTTSDESMEPVSTGEEPDRDLKAKQQLKSLAGAPARQFHAKHSLAAIASSQEFPVKRIAQ